MPYLEAEQKENNFKEELTPLTGIIIGAAIEVHKNLGPGLLESMYESCLIHELNLRQLKVEKQKPMKLYYKDVPLDCDYCLDLVVEDQVVIEIKSVNEIASIHEAQLMSYLKLSKCKLALLINFNVMLLKNGIRRYKL